jgi:anti-anti-sigma regulatory factor
MQPSAFADSPLIEISHQETMSTIRLAGVLETAAAGELHRAAQEAVTAANNVLVRWSELERLDASALQVLEVLDIELRERGRKLAFDDSPPEIIDYLRLAGSVLGKEVVRA